MERKVPGLRSKVSRWEGLAPHRRARDLTVAHPAGWRYLFTPSSACPAAVSSSWPIACSSLGTGSGWQRARPRNRGSTDAGQVPALQPGCVVLGESASPPDSFTCCCCNKSRQAPCFITTRFILTLWRPEAPAARDGSFTSSRRVWLPASPCWPAPHATITRISYR